MLRLAAVVVEAIIGTASYVIAAIVSGDYGSINLSGVLKSAFWGAVSGAVTFGIGSCFTVAATATNSVVASGMQNARFLLQAAVHAVAQGTLAMVQSGGTGFFSGASAGFFGSMGATAWSAGVGGKFASSAVGTIAFGALSGGVGAELAGGNFWQGAVTGGVVAGLNHAMHKMMKPKTTVAGIYGAGSEEGSGNPDLRGLVEGQGGRMFSSTTPFGEGDDEIIAYLKAGFEKGRELKIYGHSRGGAAAVRIANKLGAMNIHISEITLYDPVSLGGSFVFNYPNVMRVNNYYQRNPAVGLYGGAPYWILDNPFVGSPVSANFQWPVINNVNLTGHYYRAGVLMSHLNITDYAIKHP